MQHGVKKLKHVSAQGIDQQLVVEPTQARYVLQYPSAALIVFFAAARSMQPIFPTGPLFTASTLEPLPIFDGCSQKGQYNSTPHFSLNIVSTVHGVPYLTVVSQGGFVPSERLPHTQPIQLGPKVPVVTKWQQHGIKLRS